MFLSLFVCLCPGRTTVLCRCWVSECTVDGGMMSCLVVRCFSWCGWRARRACACARIGSESAALLCLPVAATRWLAQRLSGSLKMDELPHHRPVTHDTTDDAMAGTSRLLAADRQTLRRVRSTRLTSAFAVPFTRLRPGTDPRHHCNSAQLSSHTPSRICTLSQQQPPIAMADSAAALRSAGATAAAAGASIGALNPSARAPLPPIPDMPLSILIGGDAHSAAHAASAEAASAAAAASAATAAAPAVPTPPTPLHLLPPRDIQQMLDYQARA